MLRALISDLSALPGVEVITMRDARLGELDAVTRIIYVRNRKEFEHYWAAILLDIDAVWPIAPETDGILESITKIVAETGKLLLNSPTPVIKWAASKYQTICDLKDFGIPVISAFKISEHWHEFSGKWVLKPDDGVGCEGICLFQNSHQLRYSLHKLDMTQHCIVQPYVEGIPASLSMLCWEGQAKLLSCNLQRIVIDNTAFRLHGCIVNGLKHRYSLYEDLAKKIAAVKPELWGYVGVDLIDTQTGPYVVEVNPRLTISYVGLSHSLGRNPAAMVLDILKREFQFQDQALLSKQISVDLERQDVD